MIKKSRDYRKRQRKWHSPKSKGIYLMPRESVRIFTDDFYGPDISTERIIDYGTHKEKIGSWPPSRTIIL